MRVRLAEGLLRASASKRLERAHHLRAASQARHEALQAHAGDAAPRGGGDADCGALDALRESAEALREAAACARTLPPTDAAAQRLACAAAAERAALLRAVAELRAASGALPGALLRAAALLRSADAPALALADAAARGCGEQLDALRALRARAGALRDAAEEARAARGERLVALLAQEDARRERAKAVLLHAWTEQAQGEYNAGERAHAQLAEQAGARAREASLKCRAAAGVTDQERRTLRDAFPELQLEPAE